MELKINFDIAANNALRSIFRAKFLVQIYQVDLTLKHFYVQNLQIDVVGRVRCTLPTTSTL